MAEALPEPLDFSEAGRVPAPGDNVAIAVRTLAAGTRLLIRQLVFEFSHTVLEGHRFAIFRIRKGEPLLSWSLPFGLATRDIEPGEYICNEKILRALADRHVHFPLPSSPNFLDYRLPFELDAANFRPGVQVAAAASPRTFQGFRREGSRGAGTRNFIAVMGVNSRAAALARAIAKRFRSIRDQFPHLDGVVPLDHTEGGTASRPNNLDLTLRTLAGFMVNPNVGAVLCLDCGDDFLSNAALQQYLAARHYPTKNLIHEFLSVDAFTPGMNRAVEIVTAWLPRVNAFRREPLPLTHLRLGLQCGGSDAFSGVSGNPLVGLLSRDTVAHGGSANLAETDELIGAESYVLSNVRDLETARSFLEKSARFQQWAAAHGHTAEGNPSGGNMYRGLYNIAIKSIGAARKKDPATRLDYVIDFAERMSPPGFYFMDSPGNDLESIAGQAAAGCNMILFATGNGSITNFPFVPTIKIMTTTRRFELVRREMDFNAGRYQDGENLEALGREAFDYMIEIASGKPSAGEKAGHSQVQLWREWRGNSTVLDGSGEKVSARETATPLPEHIALARRIVGVSSRPHIALVLPTSLCSGQVALAIAERLNQMAGSVFDRAVALPHTEGCGNSGGESEQLFMRTMAGYLAHPFVAKALLLEHGCEKTHNDAFRNVLRDLKLSEANYGFRSVQLDGGIDRVTAKSLEWFESGKGDAPTNTTFSVALHGRDLSEAVLEGLGLLIAALRAEGAAVILSETLSEGKPLRYGQRFDGADTYAMECPTDDDLEIITGLGATGAEMIVVFCPAAALPGNPMVPTLQIATRGADADLLIDAGASPGELTETILRLILEVRSGRQKVAAQRLGNTAFQITRGREGISL